MQPDLKITILHNPTNLYIGESSVLISKSNCQSYPWSFKKNRHGEAPLDEVCNSAGQEERQRFDIFNKPMKVWSRRESLHIFTFVSTF